MVPWSEMLQVVAPYVAEMLHLKLLTINNVADVAGFQTISTCKDSLKTLNINMVVGVFDGFLSVALLPTSIPGARIEVRKIRGRSPNSCQSLPGLSFRFASIGVHWRLKFGVRLAFLFAWLAVDIPGLVRAVSWLRYHGVPMERLKKKTC